MKEKFSLDLIIRPAKFEDIDRILEIQLDAIQTINSKDYTTEEIQALVDFSKRNTTWILEYTTFVAEKNDKIIGVSSLGFLDIAAVFVDPHYTRQGVGRKLLQTVENQAKTRSWKILSVLASVTAQPFYTACGYNFVEQTSITIVISDLDKVVKIPCWEMEKWLSPGEDWERLLWSGYSGITRGARWCLNAVVEPLVDLR